MTGAPNPLQGGSDGRRRLDQHDLVEVADVDAHFQGVGGDDSPEFAALQAGFDLGADLPRQRTVVGICDGRNGVVVELQGDLLGHPAAVGEEQRRAVGVDHVAEGIGQRLPDLVAVVGRNTGGFRKPDTELDRLGDLRLDDAQASFRSRRVAPADVVGHGVKWTHRGRQRDPLELAGDLDETLEPGHELHPAPVLHHRVDLVEDHCLDRRQGLPPPYRGQQERETLRCRDEKLGWSAQHPLPVARLGVAAAGLDPDVGEVGTRGLETFTDLADGFNEVGADVVVECPQGRDVENPGSVRFGLPPREGIDGPEECRQRLAAARGSGDQQVFASGDARPASFLHIRRGTETLTEPVLDLRMEAVEGRHDRALVFLNVGQRCHLSPRSETRSLLRGSVVADRASQRPRGRVRAHRRAGLPQRTRSPASECATELVYAPPRPRAGP